MYIERRDLTIDRKLECSFNKLDVDFMSYNNMGIMVGIEFYSSAILTGQEHPIPELENIYLDIAKNFAGWNQQNLEAHRKIIDT